MTTGLKVHPARQTLSGGISPAWNGASHPDPGEPHSSAPLNLYLNKLLDPGIKPREQPSQAPVPERIEPPAEPAPPESTWQRTRNVAARAFRTASPGKQRKPDGLFHAQTPAAEAKPLSRPRPRKRTSTEGIGAGRQKLMMALIPALAATLVFVVKNPLKVSPVAPVQSVQPTAVTPVPSSDVEIVWEIPPLYLPGGRDPMRLPAPPVAPVVEEPAAAPMQTRVELVVTGILYSEDRPAAIIDTQLVHEGKQISGATVRKIERDGVEFEMNGQTWKQAVNK
jgi:hypothetical protein